MTKFYYSIFFICNNDNCNEIHGEDDLNTRDYKMPLSCKSCGNNAFYINLGYDKKDINRKVAKITKSNKLIILEEERSIMDEVMEDYENRDSPSCLEMINGLDDSEDE